MPVPSDSHIFYVPAILLLGMVLGFLLGRRAGTPGEDGRPVFDEDLDDY